MLNNIWVNYLFLAELEELLNLFFDSKNIKQKFYVNDPSSKTARPQINANVLEEAQDK